MRKEITAMFPEHHTYVEVFGGGGSILFHKRPSAVEVYNDLDSDLVNLFRVLRDNAEELQAKLELTPYSREEFYFCRDHFEEGDNVERARRYFTKIRQSFSGNSMDWSSSMTQSRGGMASTNSKVIGAINRMPEICARLRAVQIENVDFKRIISRYDTPNTLFYIDPPYLPETRAKGSANVYRHEMSQDDHLDLLNMLAGIRGKFVLSGYESNFYTLIAREQGWSVKMFDKDCSASCASRTNGAKDSGKYRRTEYLWYNFGDRDVVVDVCPACNISVRYDGVCENCTGD